jgi:hypothetical protein
VYNNSNRTRHASDFYAQPGGTFLFMGCFMYQYPKKILTISQQVQSYIDAGMDITSPEAVEKVAREKFHLVRKNEKIYLYDVPKTNK